MSREPADEPGARWSSLHHGLDPDALPLVRGWLRLMWAVARPLVRARVAPTAVTAVGALFAVAAAALASTAPAVCIGLVLLSVLCDGLDGAVAVLGNRATRRGAVADEFADRVADLAFAVVLWRCGAPLSLAAVAAALMLAVELGRRASPRGLVTITVAERPTRVVCACVALLFAALTTAAWPAVVAAVVWIVLHSIALAQLGATRRAG